MKTLKTIGIIALCIAAVGLLMMAVDAIPFPSSNNPRSFSRVPMGDYEVIRFWVGQDWYGAASELDANETPEQFDAMNESYMENEGRYVRFPIEVSFLKLKWEPIMKLDDTFYRVRAAVGKERGQFINNEFGADSLGFLFTRCHAGNADAAREEFNSIRDAMTKSYGEPDAAAASPLSQPYPTGLCSDAEPEVCLAWELGDEFIATLTLLTDGTDADILVSFDPNEEYMQEVLAEIERHTTTELEFRGIDPATFEIILDQTD